MAKNIHVVPNRGNGWRVVRANAQRASRRFTTQAEAEVWGRQLAREDGVEFTLHGLNGQIRERDSYGNDPLPPVDQEH